MKRFAFCVTWTVVLCSGLVMLAVPGVSGAAPHIRKISNPDPTRIRELTFNGKALVCYLNDAGKQIAGGLNAAKSIFTPDSVKKKRQLKGLNDRLAKASTPAQKAAIRRKIREAKQDYSDRQAECERDPSIPTPTPTLGPNDPTPTPTATPTPSVPPIPEGESLEPRVGPLSAEDVRYLVEKAGLGGVDITLEALAPQGASVVVTEFLRVKTEDSAVEDLIENWADNDITNPSTPLIPTVDGVRKSIMIGMLRSQNPFRWRMIAFFLKLFSVNNCQLSTTGATQYGQANPRQVGVSWDYFQLLRSASTTLNIPSLVKSVYRSVAMLVAHEGADSSKDAPNEKAAGVLLSRFTIGEFSYDSAGTPVRNFTRNVSGGTTRIDDLKKVALASTGYSVGLVDTGQGAEQIWASQYTSSDHATGPHILFDGTIYEMSVEKDDDMITDLFTHPAAAENWSRLLLREFVTPNPPHALVQGLATEIKNNNFVLGPVMQKLFSSQAFWYAGYRNTIAKDPIQLIAETSRVLYMGSLSTQNVTQLVDYVRNTNRTTATTAYGMGYDYLCPSSTDYFQESFLGGGGGLLANVQFIGRMIDAGIDNSRTTTPLWSINDVNPVLDYSVGQLIDFFAPKFGVSVTDEQREEIQFAMDFVVNGGSSGLTPYDNTLTGDDIYHRQGKGAYLLNFLMSLPGYHLR